MVREKIKIEKIVSTPARQVTFSKRRRGLIKKARELSILCDADVGLVVFSSTGKLYEFSNSSMKEIFEKYNDHPSKVQKLGMTTTVFQVEASKQAQLRKELEKSNSKLRQMRGEVDGLTLQELHDLQKTLELGLHRILQKKAMKMPVPVKQSAITANPVGTLQGRGTLCLQSVDVISTDCEGPFEFNDTLDTSLRLGLPFPN